MKIKLIILLLFIGFYSQANNELGGIGLTSMPSPNGQQSFDIMDIFDEVEKFEQGSFILHIGSGLAKDVNVENTSIKTVIPPITILLEKAYWKNIGIGAKLGYRWWKIDKLNFNYMYYSLAFRGTYHFNFLENLDPYVGIATTFRFITFTGDKPSDSNFDYQPLGLVIGGRYYLTEKLGAYLEFAPDGQTNFHLGFVFKLN